MSLFLLLLLLLFLPPTQAMHQLHGRRLDWAPHDGRSRRTPTDTFVELDVREAHKFGVKHEGLVQRTSSTHGVFLFSPGTTIPTSARRVAAVHPSHKRPPHLVEEGHRQYLVRVARHGADTEKTRQKIETACNCTVTFHGATRALLDNFTHRPTTETFASVLEVGGVSWMGHRPKTRLLTVESSAQMIGALGVDQFPGANVTVAVGDTGLDVGHCFFYDPNNPVVYATLQSDPLTLPTSTHSKIVAYVSVCTSASTMGCNPTDRTDFTNGHGTHVAGILVGARCVGRYGSAPSAKVVFFDLAADASGFLSLPISLSAMFETARLAGAVRFSASWGAGADGGYGDLAAQFDEYTHRHPDFLMTVAYGNAGLPGCTPAGGCGGGDPGTCKNCLSVGATMISTAAYADGSRKFLPSDVATYPQWYSQTAVASFSSVGPNADGRVGPMIATPGVAVLSSDARPSEGGGHSEMLLMSGTSMSTPNTPDSNMVQCLRSRGAPTSAAIRVAWAIAAAVQPHTVVQLSFGSTTSSARPTGDDPHTRVGFGVLTFGDVLCSEEWTFVEMDVDGSGTSALCFRSATTTPTASTPITVAIAWTDPVPAANAASTLVNPVALVVTTQDGGLLLSQQDWVNNRKRLDFSVVGGGTFRVGVAASALPVGGTQKVAVVIRGELTSVGCWSACSPYEPRPSCSWPHGSAEVVCVDGVRSCMLTVCDEGWALDGTTNECVASSPSDPLTQGCPQGFFWRNGTCACLQHDLCPDGTVAGCLGGGSVYVACSSRWPTAGAPQLFSTNSTPSGGPPIVVPYQTTGFAGWSIASNVLFFALTLCFWCVTFFLRNRRRRGAGKSVRSWLDVPTWIFVMHALNFAFGEIALGLAAGQLNVYTAEQLSVSYDWVYPLIFYVVWIAVQICLLMHDAAMSEAVEEAKHDVKTADDRVRESNGSTAETRTASLTREKERAATRRVFPKWWGVSVLWTYTFLAGGVLSSVVVVYVSSGDWGFVVVVGVTLLLTFVFMYEIVFVRDNTKCCLLFLGVMFVVILSALITSLAVGTATTSSNVVLPVLLVCTLLFAADTWWERRSGGGVLVRCLGPQ